ncbi:MAG: low affinity iron permease family protein [Verrucomicrobiota bacterium]|nr:low affinity iron permease family protein [Verrucomicrobiota bacterium]
MTKKWPARNRLMKLEALSGDELEKFQREFEPLRKRTERPAATVSEVGRRMNSH